MTTPCNRLSPNGHKVFLPLPPGTKHSLLDWTDYDRRCFIVACEYIIHADVIKKMNDRIVIICDVVDYNERLDNEYVEWVEEQDRVNYELENNR